MLFQGVLLAAALQNQAGKPIVEVVIYAAGVMVSIYQMQMASGAKFWQEWWESRVDEYERKLRDIKIKDSENFNDLFAVSFDDVRKTIRDRLEKDRKWSITNFLILRAFSIGRAPIKVGLLLAVVWSLLFLHSVNFSKIPNFNEIFTGVYFSPSPK